MNTLTQNLLLEKKYIRPEHWIITVSDLQIRVRNGELYFLFLKQKLCCHNVGTQKLNRSFEHQNTYLN